MQFQVPQFIDVEDKIFGPLTFKQFVYVLGGLGSAYLAFRSLPLYLALPLMLAGVGLGVSLAFFQYNGRPFILALEHGFFYLIHPKLYLWNNERKNTRAVAKSAVPLSIGMPYVPKLSDSKLHELAWSLDITERIEGGVASQHDRDLAADRFASLVAPVRTAREALVR